MTIEPCLCYIRYLPATTRFALRRGAHQPTCPQHRASADHIDRLADGLLRFRLESATLHYIDGADPEYEAWLDARAKQDPAEPGAYANERTL